MHDDDAYLNLTGQRSTHGYGHAQDPATDDIVTRLRCEQHYSKPNADPCICSVCSTLTAAIDEIERFTAENKHLLAEVVRLSALLHHIEEEARRG